MNKRNIVPAAALAASLLFSLSSCLLPSPRERIRIERMASENFPPKARASEVTILPNDPAVPFVSVARIYAQGTAGGSITVLLEEIQQHAAMLGADAVIRVKTGTRVYSGTGQSPGLQQDYGLEAPLGSASSVSSAGTQIPWATGLAIRYTKEGEKR